MRVWDRVRNEADENKRRKALGAKTGMHGEDCPENNNSKKKKKKAAEPCWLRGT